MTDSKRIFLSKLFQKAVDAAHPEMAMKKHLPRKPIGRTIVIGAGKASAQMAQILEKLWRDAGYGALQGCVVTRYGGGVITDHIEVIEAAHPVPDENGLLASDKLMALIQNLTADDLVIALISGGGSALLPAPLGNMSLQDEIDVNEALLKSGAPITAMNAIRKHLSKIKGGRLAFMAAPAKVVSFIMSDIPGDIASQVASGPTVPDTLTRFDALQYMEQYKIKLPEIALHVLNDQMCDAPKPDDKCFAQNEVYIVASSAVSLKAAAQYAEQQDMHVVTLSDSMEGEAKEVALIHAIIATDIVQNTQSFSKPIILLSGGETTVTIQSTFGKGGRNSEFLLAFAIAIKGNAKITALAADTDGIDGSENNAGAFCDGTTVLRMIEKNVDPVHMLLEHDAYSAFSKIDDLFVTGPTGTNVNDFRAIMIA